MPEASLDAALDELYGAAPSDFVATRKRLIADLRGAGATDSAKELQGARRPSTAAWALNQLARRHPDLIQDLLDQGSALQAAQTRAVSGKGDSMRAAVREHRKALDRATDAALAILGARSSDAFRNEIASTLHAASADDDTGRLLRTGRLIREAQFQGFPDATGLTLVPDPPESEGRVTRKASKSETTRADRSRTVDADARADAKAEATLAREREARRRSNLAARDAALKEAAAADAAAMRSQARIDKLEDELDVARRSLSAARDRSRKATDEAARIDAAVQADARP